MEAGVTLSKERVLRGFVSASLALAGVVTLATPAFAHTYDGSNPYGDATSVYGRRAVLGVPGADGSTGLVYQYRYGNAGWQKMATLVPVGASPGDSFGAAVAFDGNAVFVGAPGVSSGEGTVTEVAHLSGNWGPVATVHASSPIAGAHFGQAIALSGRTIAIGAPGSSVAGSVTVASITPSGIVVKATLAAPTPAVGDEFGASVALAKDTLVVGAPGTDAAAGAAYLYHFAAKTWNLVATLELTSPVAANAFGRAVAIAGTTVAVGAPGRSVSGQAGAGVVATFAAASGAVDQVLTEQTPTRCRHLGQSLAAFDGSLVAGAPGDVAVGGGATLYRISSGTWTVTSTLNSTSTNSLGWSVGAGRGTTTIKPSKQGPPLLVVVTGRGFVGALGA